MKSIAGLNVKRKALGAWAQACRANPALSRAIASLSQVVMLASGKQVVILNLRGWLPRRIRLRADRSQRTVDPVAAGQCHGRCRAVTADVAR
jgi:hypothetical protein